MDAADVLADASRVEKDERPSRKPDETKKKEERAAYMLEAKAMRIIMEAVGRLMHGPLSSC